MILDSESVSKHVDRTKVPPFLVIVMVFRSRPTFQDYSLIQQKSKQIYIWKDSSFLEIIGLLDLELSPKQLFDIKSVKCDELDKRLAYEILLENVNFLSQKLTKTIGNSFQIGDLLEIEIKV
jgi:hypothetical protein